MTFESPSGYRSNFGANGASAMSYKQSEPTSPRRPVVFTWWAGVTLLIMAIVLATAACSRGKAGMADAPEG